jgi:hypothetical protein
VLNTNGELLQRCLGQQFQAGQIRHRCAIRVWPFCGRDAAGLLASDNGDLPIWVTFEAIEALRLANLAFPGRSMSL